MAAGFNPKHLFYFWKVARCGGVARAADELGLAAHTISSQLSALERSLGTLLFSREGRALVLTDAGRLALSYADQIFSLQAEMQDALEREQRSRTLNFRVGVADAVPKSVAWRLLAPALQLDRPVRMVCREWRLPNLLSELALHNLDIVIADAPVPQALDVRAYSRRVAESPVLLYASPELAASIGSDLPGALDGRPLLLPGEDSPLRMRVTRAFERARVRPVVVGEFDGSSLMYAAGQAGLGVFAAPALIREEIAARYASRPIGPLPDVQVEFYAISVDRHQSHPCVAAVGEAFRRTDQEDATEPSANSAD